MYNFYFFYAKIHYMKILLVIFFLFNFENALSKDKSPEPVTWNQDLKELIFGDEQLLDGSHLFSLDTPYRALDAAMVPI